VRPSLGIESNGLSHRKREARVTTVSARLTSPWRRATRWEPFVPRHGRHPPPVVFPLFETRGYGRRQRQPSTEPFHGSPLCNLLSSPRTGADLARDLFVPPAPLPPQPHQHSASRLWLGPSRALLPAASALLCARPSILKAPGVGTKTFPLGPTCARRRAAACHVQHDYLRRRRHSPSPPHVPLPVTPALGAAPLACTS